MSHFRKRPELYNGALTEFCLLLFIGVINISVSQPRDGSNFTNPASPQKPQFEILSDYAVQISWKPMHTADITVQLQRLDEGQDVYRVIAQDIPHTQTTYIDSPLVAYKEYAYRIKIEQIPNFNAYSDPVFLHTEMSVPAKPMLYALSDHEINIQRAYSEQRDCLVQRMIDGIYRDIGEITSAMPGIIDSTLISDCMYRYRLSARSAYNTSAYSLSDSIFLPFQAPDITSAISQSAGSIKLFINDSSRYASKLVIWKNFDGKWHSIDTVDYGHELELHEGSLRSRFYNDTTVIPNQKQGYRVSNLTRHNASKLTKAKYHINQLAKPFNFVADPIHDTIVQLQWQDTTLWINHFILMRSILLPTNKPDGKANMTFSKLDSLPVGANYFTDTTVAYGKPYQYRLYGKTIEGFKTGYVEYTENIVPPPQPMIMINEGKWFWSRYGRKFSSGDSFTVDNQIGGFLIDRYEVTIQEYAEFCAETKHPLPQSGAIEKFHGIQSKFPVTEISWIDAIRFCNWRSQVYQLQPVYNEQGEINHNANGYKLPTEAQFQLAVQSDSSLFKGMLIGALQDNVNLWQPHDPNSIPEIRLDTLISTETNAIDLIGNVWEWCQDPYKKLFKEMVAEFDYAQKPKHISNDVRLVSGGSFSTPVTFAKEPLRFGHSIQFRSSNIGFRCVRNIETKSSEQKSITK